MPTLAVSLYVRWFVGLGFPTLRLIATLTIKMPCWRSVAEEGFKTLTQYLQTAVDAAVDDPIQQFLGCGRA